MTDSINSKSNNKVLASFGTDREHLVTEFQRRVYEECARIPEGQVRTYGQLAKALSTSPRAVGRALSVNPFAPTVPCHRVVAAGGWLQGFHGQSDPRSLQQKANMLRKEGVQVDMEKFRVDHF